MAFNIKSLKAAMPLGGARPTQFSVEITPPSLVDLEGIRNLRFFTEAAQLPSSELGLIEIAFFGRRIKLAGDRTFPEWTTTVINEEDFRTRNALEQWSSKINGLTTNRANYRRFEGVAGYKTTAKVIQYDKNGGVVREYEFDGIFPQVVSEIETNWDETDAIERFSVTWQYDQYRVTQRGSSNKIGEDLGNTVTDRTRLR